MGGGLRSEHGAAEVVPEKRRRVPRAVYGAERSLILFDERLSVILNIMSAVSTHDANPNFREFVGKQRAEPSLVTAAPVSNDGRPVQEDDVVVIGSTVGLAAAVARVGQVAPTDAPV